MPVICTVVDVSNAGVTATPAAEGSGFDMDVVRGTGALLMWLLGLAGSRCTGSCDGSR